MAFALHGIPVSRGIVIGRVQLLAPAALEVPHYLVVVDQIDDEVARLDEAVATVVNELYQVQSELPATAPPEFAALLDLHRLILQDPLLSEEPARLIRQRRYNAEWHSRRSCPPSSSSSNRSRMPTSRRGGPTSNRSSNGCSRC